ncbi:hypothetical protein FIBSPDRAFT_344165 [Athelia psychrophila]|uniref:Uncharacterized protein n=1 Tax=Athelia psychrophila TaxID=1759441 RepID=A0A167W4E5_9AGAM|nr:hypothetical protein FIBSPDRAFT_344165 [Fibularhizoctonia sp. CBS 109695]
MSQSQALTVISTPVADDPVPPAARALIPNYGDRVVQNGPGMHLNLAFTAGGVYLEAGLRGVAKLLELGPVPVVKAIETVFADAAQRIAILDELFLLRAPPPPADENSAAQLQPKASKTIVKLKKLCRKLLKFTSSSELPDTQLLAYKGIVMLTTRYIGLRLLFVEQLPFKDGAQQPSKHDIVDAWRHGSSGEPEWEFWLQFAAYCLASPDEITVAVETLKPSNFGCFEGGQCISERLSHWISSAFAANEESRLIAVRYLAGILELPSFWDFRIKNDLHSASDVLCLVCIRLLEDLAVECREQHFVRISDLVSLDPEGINVLVFAILNLLPLEQLPDDSIRSTTSLEIAKMLKQRLQTERSKALFPDASERAERFLQKPETAPDNPMDDAPAPRDILFIAVMGISGTGKSSVHKTFLFTKKTWAD